MLDRQSRLEFRSAFRLPAKQNQAEQLLTEPGETIVDRARRSKYGRTRQSKCWQKGRNNYHNHEGTLTDKNRQRNYHQNQAAQQNQSEQLSFSTIFVVQKLYFFPLFALFRFFKKKKKTNLLFLKFPRYEIVFSKPQFKDIYLKNPFQRNVSLNQLDGISIFLTFWSLWEIAAVIASSSVWLTGRTVKIRLKIKN